MKWKDKKMIDECILKDEGNAENLEILHDILDKDDLFMKFIWLYYKDFYYKLEFESNNWQITKKINSFTLENLLGKKTRLISVTIVFEDRRNCFSYDNLIFEYKMKNKPKIKYKYGLLKKNI